MMSSDRGAGWQRWRELHVEGAGHRVERADPAHVPAPGVVPGPPGKRLAGAELAALRGPAPARARSGWPGVPRRPARPARTGPRRSPAARRPPGRAPVRPSGGPLRRWVSTLRHASGSRTDRAWSASRPRTSMARRWHSAATWAGTGLLAGSARDRPQRRGHLGQAAGQLRGLDAGQRAAAQHGVGHRGEQVLADGRGWQWLVAGRPGRRVRVSQLDPEHRPRHGRQLQPPARRRGGSGEMSSTPASCQPPSPVWKFSRYRRPWSSVSPDPPNGGKLGGPPASVRAGCVTSRQVLTKVVTIAARSGARTRVCRCTSPQVAVPLGGQRRADRDGPVLAGRWPGGDAGLGPARPRAAGRRARHGEQAPGSRQAAGGQRGGEVAEHATGPVPSETAPTRRRALSTALTRSRPASSGGSPPSGSPRRATGSAGPARARRSSASASSRTCVSAAALGTGLAAAPGPRVVVHVERFLGRPLGRRARCAGSAGSWSRWNCARASSRPARRVVPGRARPRGAVPSTGPARPSPRPWSRPGPPRSAASWTGGGRCPGPASRRAGRGRPARRLDGCTRGGSPACLS